MAKKPFTTTDAPLNSTLVDNDRIILLLVETGSGKSTFVNCAMARDVASVGHGKTPETMSINHFTTYHPTEHTQSRVILVDNPGFNTELWKDYEILTRLVKWLKKSLQGGSRRRISIVYLLEVDQSTLRNGDDRMSPKSLSAPGVVEHSAIVATKWMHLLDTEFKRRRHQKVLSKAYGREIDLHFFDNTLGSAWQIIDSCAASPVNGAQFRHILAEILPGPKSRPRFSIARFLMCNLGTIAGFRATIKRDALLSETTQSSPAPSHGGAYGSQNAHSVAQLAKISSRLKSAFDDEHKYKRLLSCEGSEAQALLDTFQLILRMGRLFGLEGNSLRNLRVATFELSSKTELYPSTFHLTNVERLDDNPVASGGFADIYMGILAGRDHVCLKIIRVYRSPTYDQMLKKIAREAVAWGQLSHPNLLPLYGLSYFGRQLALVSPWAEKGNLLEFLQSHPAVNRVLLCSDTARGLAYLHDNDIIHGDLKGENVLVDQSSRAYLADFGLSAIEDAKFLSQASKPLSGSKGGTTRWQAPELFRLKLAEEGEDAPQDAYEIYNTKATDVYAWSCSCYEVFTGVSPFAGISSNRLVMLKVTAGERPKHPASLKEQSTDGNGLTDDMWQLMNECWAQDPANRPSIADALSRRTVLHPEDRRLPGEWEARRTTQKEDFKIPLTLEALTTLILAHQEQTHKEIRAGQKRQFKDNDEPKQQLIFPSGSTKSILTVAPPKPLNSARVTLSERLGEISARLETAFSDTNKYKRLLACQGMQAQALLDTFHLILSVLSLDDHHRRNIIVAPKRLSSKTDLYPRQFFLQDVERIDENPVDSGRYADIYRGSFQGTPVALKIIRVQRRSTYDRILKEITREAILWGQLSNPNLLPFYGVYRNGSQLWLVSPWASNGNIIDFLRANPGANRVHLCSDVVGGVAYLHGNDIVHGDLKGENILVDGSSRAYLCDFGLSGIEDPEVLHWSSQSRVGSRGGTLRWQAPELFDNDSAPLNTYATDIYAWSGVCYEIFTGRAPFFEDRESTAVRKILTGETPKRPGESESQATGLTENIWALMSECWARDPCQRPTIQKARQRLITVQTEDRRSLGEWKAASALQKRSLHDSHVPLTLEDLNLIIK